jgi:catechol 2,3-dioxygenase-like lactoylglutathione lyase family enzyme
MRLLLTILFFIVSVTVSPAQTISVKPRLVALQVKELARSKDWYSKHLNFEAKEEMEFKDHRLRIAFLQHEEFKLELIDNENAFFIKDVVPDANDKKPAIGFSKLTFEVANIQQAYEQLKKSDAKFVYDLTVSNLDRSEKWFMLEDPDGNIIQLIGK